MRCPVETDEIRDISDKLAFLWIINHMGQLENFRLKVFRASRNT